MADTIAAVSTGSSVSAIGIIRLSGDGAIETAERVFRPLKGALSEKRSRELTLGSLYAADGALLDKCLCTISRAPNSYTGEDTAEIQCHGSPVVLAEGLRAVFAAGARQALAGEFTKRAFLNGRLDLTQAEAVIDLIESETAESAKNAAGQLGGAISEKINGVYTPLLDMISHFQAVIDYPDEDIDEFEAGEYSAVLRRAESELRALLATFSRGGFMKNGVPAAIIGRPNAGKSSLLNALAGYERAIVTAAPGTTRDTVEERVRLGGVVLKLIDTAGLRDARDEAERLGVSRARKAAENAALVLAVFDGSAPPSLEDVDARAQALAGKLKIAVLNKSDLGLRGEYGALTEGFDAVCNISARTGEGLESLENAVSSLIGALPPVPQGEILTNARQAETVTRALSALSSAREALESGVTPDAVLTDVEAALSALGELTGRTVRDDVVSRIFERFCVGK